MPLTRRSFISTGTAAATMLYTAGWPRAAYLNLPVGLQLYSVRTLLPKDYAGTLKQVGALGYTEVEAAGFFNLPVEAGAGCDESCRAALRQRALSALLVEAAPGRDHSLLQEAGRRVYRLRLTVT